MASQEDRTLISKAKVEEFRAEQRVGALDLVSGPGAPSTYRLALPAIVVGRDPGADIFIESQELSRKHMRVVRVGEEYMCVDLDSVNGIYLNGVKVHSAVLRDGDQLQLADAVFLFRGKA